MEGTINNRGPIMEVHIGPRGPETHPVIPETDERPSPINHGFNYQQNVNPGGCRIWLIGSSIVYWARRSVFFRPGGMDLGLQTSGCRISWFVQRGMTWKQFTPAVCSYLDRHPSPGMILIQLGSNDLGSTKRV